jgi:hypothetical protein
MPWHRGESHVAALTPFVTYDAVRWVSHPLPPIGRESLSTSPRTAPRGEKLRSSHPTQTRYAHPDDGLAAPLIAQEHSEDRSQR